MKRIAAALLLGRPTGLAPVSVPRYAWRILIAILFLFLIAAEVLRVYFLMPNPGSQVSDTLPFVYELNRSIGWIRLIGLLALSVAFLRLFRNGRVWEKGLLFAGLAGYAVVFFLFNFRMQADHIFHQPVNKSFTTASATDMERSKLVIGVVVNGKAKAYPIQLIGYHHQVMDSIGNTAVMVTYCTVCRSGRVYSPIVNGKPETFRLVGMDHFNAVFEDATTKSWWQQATGVAITGQLKGYALKEFSSTQVTLESWMRQHPNSLVMDPDSLYMDNYFKLEDYDKGLMKSDLVRRDTSSWRPKSWVVGVKNNEFSKAYDWNELLRKKMIQDSVNDMPIVLMMEQDSASFHVYDRRIDGQTLRFQSRLNNEQLVDSNSGSSWNMDGECVEGKWKGRKLLAVQSYNEFWHSWQTFQSRPKIYVLNKQYAAK